MALPNTYWLGITRAGGGAIYLHGFDNKAIIKDYGEQLQSLIQVDPIPLHGSDGTIAFTQTGVICRIKIQGKLIGAPTELAVKIDTIESMMNGIQRDASIDASGKGSMGYHFMCDFQKTTYPFRVGIEQFKWNWKNAEVAEITYNMTLVQIR